MQSIFVHKTKKPTESDLKNALGKTFSCWQQLENFTKELYPAAKSEWHFSGEKYGWSYRISDKKRVIIYLLPREQFFKVAFVFGQKAFDQIMTSSVNENIKKELAAAKVYAEGRGIRIEVKNSSLIKNIQQLIEIKIAH